MRRIPQIVSRHVAAQLGTWRISAIFDFSNEICKIRVLNRESGYATETVYMMTLISGASMSKNYALRLKNRITLSAPGIRQPERWPIFPTTFKHNPATEVLLVSTSAQFMSLPWIKQLYEMEKSNASKVDHPDRANAKPQDTKGNELYSDGIGTTDEMHGDSIRSSRELRPLGSSKGKPLTDAQADFLLGKSKPVDPKKWQQSSLPRYGRTQEGKYVTNDELIDYLQPGIAGLESGLTLERPTFAWSQLIRSDPLYASRREAEAAERSRQAEVEIATDRMNLVSSDRLAQQQMEKHARGIDALNYMRQQPYASQVIQAQPTFWAMQNQNSQARSNYWITYKGEDRITPERLEESKAFMAIMPANAKKTVSLPRHPNPLWAERGPYVRHSITEMDV